MAELTSKGRSYLKDVMFGLPEERKYPMPDRSHAANAKARATQQLAAGNLTSAEAAEIRRKANAILNRQ